jgi:hypothetical protein
MSTEHTSAPNPIIVDLDTLTNVCGHFNSDTEANNGYGCEHPDCDDKDLMRNTPEGSIRKHNLEYKITAAAMRRQYGSMKNIMEALDTEEGKAFFGGLKHKMRDPDFVAGFGCKLQGVCLSFTCPVAYSADLEDLKQYGQSYYDEWKDEEYSPEESGADLMVVYDADLISKLS